MWLEFLSSRAQSELGPFYLLVLIITVPTNVIVVAASRMRSSRSLRKTTPNSTAKTMLDSRSADTSAKGAKVNAQLTSQTATSDVRPANSPTFQLRRTSRDSFKRLTEFERFSLYSMAMIEGVHFTSDSKTLGSAKKPLQHQNQTQ